VSAALVSPVPWLALSAAALLRAWAILVMASFWEAMVELSKAASCCSSCEALSTSFQTMPIFPCTSYCRCWMAIFWLMQITLPSNTTAMTTAEMILARVQKGFGGVTFSPINGLVISPSSDLLSYLGSCSLSYIRVSFLSFEFKHRHLMMVNCHRLPRRHRRPCQRKSLFLCLYSAKQESVKCARVSGKPCRR